MVTSTALQKSYLEMALYRKGAKLIGVCWRRQFRSILVEGQPRGREMRRWRRCCAELLTGCTLGKEMELDLVGIRGEEMAVELELVQDMGWTSLSWLEVEMVGRSTGRRGRGEGFPGRGVNKKQSIYTDHTFGELEENGSLHFDYFDYWVGYSHWERS